MGRAEFREPEDRERYREPADVGVRAAGAEAAAQAGTAPVEAAPRDSGTGGKGSGGSGAAGAAGTTGGSSGTSGSGGVGGAGGSGGLVCPTPPTGTSYAVDTTGVTFTTSSGLTRVQVCKEDIIRVTYTTASSIPAKTSLSVSATWGTPTLLRDRVGRRR